MKFKSMFSFLAVMIISQNSFAQLHGFDECNPPMGMTLAFRPEHCPSELSGSREPAAELPQRTTVRNRAITVVAANGPECNTSASNAYAEFINAFLDPDDEAYEPEGGKIRLSQCQSGKRQAEDKNRDHESAVASAHTSDDYNILRVIDGNGTDPLAASRAMRAVDCEESCVEEDAPAPAPGDGAAASTGPAGYSNGGRAGPMTNGFAQAPSCLQPLQTIDVSCDPARVCVGDGADECEGPANRRRFKQTARVDFQNYESCKTFSPIFAESAAAPVVTDKLKAKACSVATSACSSVTDQTLYGQCVSQTATQHLRAVVVGIQKCAAIKSAGDGTTRFEEDGRVSSIDGKITCKRHTGLAFDYPSCKSFITWYNTLVAAQTGVQMYNEGDKITTGMRAQNEAAQAVATGNGQEAGIEASRKTINASASAEERNKLFFMAKGAAITSQLMSFVTKGNVGSSCEGNENCCALFDADAGDSITNADSFFPNASEKDKMIAEVIRAGGEAALAAMKEQELRRQAAALKAIKDQMTAPEDSPVEGIMKFCLQFPQDVKCLGPGNRVVSGGAAFRGPSFSGQNMGLGNLGTATSEDLGVEQGSAGAIGGPTNSIGDIGSTDKAAADAKAEFDAPSALRGGGGSPTISGGGGGAGASASANGLSNDPGVEGDKKETPLKMTSKSASYDGGTAYTGGGYRAGAGDKKDAAANPFASMFGKDKGRSPSAVPEIDSPASDLFTKISNRYGEVQKRKALMEVR